MFKGAQSTIGERASLKGARAAVRRYWGHREITLLYASIKNSDFSIFIGVIIILKVFRHVVRGAFTELCWAASRCTCRSGCARSQRQADILGSRSCNRCNPPVISTGTRPAESRVHSRAVWFTSTHGHPETLLISLHAHGHKPSLRKMTTKDPWLFSTTKGSTYDRRYLGPLYSFYQEFIGSLSHHKQKGNLLKILSVEILELPFWFFVQVSSAWFKFHDGE